MATLWIREYRAVGRSGSIPIPHEPGTDQAPLTFGGDYDSVSAAFATSTTFVRIIGSAAFHYVVGGNDVEATTDAMKAPADTWVEFGVTAGQKIAAIAAA